MGSVMGLCHRISTRPEQNPYITHTHKTALLLINLAVGEGHYALLPCCLFFTAWWSIIPRDQAEILSCEGCV